MLLFSLALAPSTFPSTSLCSLVEIFYNSVKIYTELRWQEQISSHFSHVRRKLKCQTRAKCVCEMNRENLMHNKNQIFSQFLSCVNYTKYAREGARRDFYGCNMKNERISRRSHFTLHKSVNELQKEAKKNYQKNISLCCSTQNSNLQCCHLQEGSRQGLGCPSESCCCCRCSHMLEQKYSVVN